MTRKKNKMKLMSKVIVAEVFITIVFLSVILFKHFTDNIFFPEVKNIILIWIFVAGYVGLGIGYDKL